jgi:hypothetical protein
MKAIV